MKRKCTVKKRLKLQTIEGKKLKTIFSIYRKIADSTRKLNDKELQKMSTAAQSNANYAVLRINKFDLDAE